MTPRQDLVHPLPSVSQTLGTPHIPPSSHPLCVLVPCLMDRCTGVNLHTRPDLVGLRLHLVPWPLQLVRKIAFPHGARASRPVQHVARPSKLASRRTSLRRASSCIQTSTMTSHRHPKRRLSSSRRSTVSDARHRTRSVLTRAGQAGRRPPRALRTWTARHSPPPELEVLLVSPLSVSCGI